MTLARATLAPANGRRGMTVTRARRARAMRAAAAREEETSGREDYARPVQKRDELLESEAFETALKAGFAVFCVVCVGAVLNLAGPVVGEMVHTFPGRR